MTKSKITVFLTQLIIGLAFLTACEETLDQSDPVVVSEDVVYLSGEVVRITGRILSLPAKGVDDRGFEFDTNEGFTNPIQVSNGPTDLPGRYISIYESLETSTLYYARSYVEVDGEIFYGTVVTFSTLGPFLTSFEPQVGLQSTVVTIVGGNFTQDTKVFVNDNEATIVDISFESVIRFRVPAITTEQFAEVKVVIQGEEFVFADRFEYIIGKWEVATHFINDTQILEPMSFAVGNEAFLGLGRVLSTGDYDKIWKLNLDTYDWQEVAFSGSYTRQPFFGNGYFGAGKAAPTAPYTPNYEFWMYDSNTSAFVQDTSVPFGLANAITVKSSNGIFVMGGFEQFNTPNDKVYYYDNSSKVWSIFSEPGFEFPSTALYFEYQENLYILFSGGLFRYDVQANQLFFISNFPGSAGNKAFTGFAEVINDKVYIGLFENNAEVWEFELSNFVWRRKAFFTGFTSELTVGHWVYNNKIYLVRTTLSSFANSDLMEIWTFEPDKF